MVTDLAKMRLLGILGLVGIRGHIYFDHDLVTQPYLLNQGNQICDFFYHKCSVTVATRVIFLGDN